jgi:hypothetical protein
MFSFIRKKGVTTILRTEIYSISGMSFNLYLSMSKGHQIFSFWHKKCVNNHLWRSYKDKISKKNILR